MSISSKTFSNDAANRRARVEADHDIPKYAEPFAKPYFAGASVFARFERAVYIDAGGRPLDPFVSWYEIIPRPVFLTPRSERR